MRLVLLFLFSSQVAFAALQGPVRAQVRGIAIFPAGEEDLPDWKDIEGVEIWGVDVPGGDAGLRESLSPYIGERITPEEIRSIKRTIVEIYKKNGSPLVRIASLHSPFYSKVLAFTVQEAKLGEVRARGNQNFSSRVLERGIRMAPGQPIRTAPLAYDLDWINRNPFRTTNLVFTPTNVPGIADIELVTEDQYPWRVYTGVDNTGINPSGANRWYGGFNWGNAFGLDHILTYQFTSGSSYNEFWSHTVNYTAPLSWYHTLDLYGGVSKVRSAVPGTIGVFTHGTSAQASLRYEIPLPTRRSFLEEFTWGFDWKLTNTNLYQGREFFFGNTINITQLMVNYNAGLETEYSKNSGVIEIFYSPGRWLPGQTVADYSSLRAGARVAYVYSRVALASIVKMRYNFTFEPTVRAQISSCNLISSEQFSLGGYNTVRGYQEREVNADNAIVLNVEFRTPGFSPVWFSDWWKRHVRDEMKFLYFMDYGYGHNHKLTFGEPTFQWLWGTGFGVRYASPKYFSVRADYAFRLHDLLLTNVVNRPHMFYFGVTASY